MNLQLVLFRLYARRLSRVYTHKIHKAFCQLNARIDIFFLPGLSVLRAMKSVGEDVMYSGGCCRIGCYLVLRQTF